MVDRRAACSSENQERNRKAQLWRRDGINVKKTKFQIQMPDFLKLICKSGRENLSAEGKKKLVELLAKHQGAFAKGPDDLGRTHLVQHEIWTPPDLRPLWQSARRLPFWKQTEAKEIVDDLLRRDLIEPSTSPWADPVVMVKKKDNTTRLKKSALPGSRGDRRWEWWPIQRR